MNLNTHKRSIYRSLLAAAVATALSMTPAWAQTAPAEPDSVTILTRTVCSNSLAELIAYVGQRFGEKPLAEFGTAITMQSLIPGVPPSVIPGAGVLMVNPQTGTYTMLMQLRDTEGACMISSGLNFRPYGSEKPKPTQKQKM